MNRKFTKKQIALVIVGGALGAALLGTGIALDSWVAEGPGMEPTLVNGDRFVTTPFSGAEVGDVVVVESPDEGFTIIKRVVAVGGDTIEIREDILYRNGESVERSEVGPASSRFPSTCWNEHAGGESWTVVNGDDSPPSDMPPIEVPPGHVFVIGDHRDRSNDSRFFGSLPVENIRGVFVGRYLRGEGVTCP